MQTQNSSFSSARKVPRHAVTDIHLLIACCLPPSSLLGSFPDDPLVDFSEQLQVKAGLEKVSPCFLFSTLDVSMFSVPRSSLPFSLPYHQHSPHLSSRLRTTRTTSSRTGVTSSTAHSPPSSPQSSPARVRPDQCSLPSQPSSLFHLFMMIFISTTRHK